jgi:hypothetical protein
LPQRLFTLRRPRRTVAAARVFGHARMGPLADRTIAALKRSLAREPEAALHRGMPFPPRRRV